MEEAIAAIASSSDDDNEDIPDPPGPASAVVVFVIGLVLLSMWIQPVVPATYPDTSTDCYSSDSSGLSYLSHSDDPRNH